MQALPSRTLASGRLVPLTASLAVHVVLAAMALVIATSGPRGQVIFLELTELPAPPPDVPPRVVTPSLPKPVSRPAPITRPAPIATPPSTPVPAAVEPPVSRVEPDPTAPAIVPAPAKPVTPAPSGIETTSPPTAGGDTIPAVALTAPNGIPSGASQPQADARGGSAAPAPAVASLPREGLTQRATPRDGYQDRPAYPISARLRRIQGTTLLAVLVADDGRVAKVVVKESAGHPDLDEAATQAVRRWRFDPARRGSEPVAVWVELPVEFRLR